MIPPWPDDDDQLARMGLGDVVERLLRPVQELEPALAARRQRPLGVVAGQQPPVALVALGPGQPVRLAGVALAQLHVGLVGDVAEGGRQDLGRLDGAAEDARVERRRALELAGAPRGGRRGRRPGAGRAR